MIAKHFPEGWTASLAAGRKEPGGTHASSAGEQHPASPPSPLQHHHLPAGAAERDAAWGNGWGHGFGALERGFPAAPLPGCCPAAGWLCGHCCPRQGAIGSPGKPASRGVNRGLPNPPRTAAFATAAAVVQTGVYYGICSTRLAVSAASLSAHATPAANSPTAGPGMLRLGPWERDPHADVPQNAGGQGWEARSQHLPWSRTSRRMELARLRPSHLADPKPEHGSVP